MSNGSSSPIGLVIPAHHVLETLVGTDHVELNGFERPRERLLPAWLPESAIGDAASIARENKRLGRYLRIAHLAGIALIAAGSAAIAFAAAQPGECRAAGGTSTPATAAGNSSPPGAAPAEPQKPAPAPAAALVP